MRPPVFTGELSEVNTRLEVQPPNHVRLDFRAGHPNSTAVDSTVFLTATDIIMLRGLLASGLDVLNRAQEKSR
jgi:hypothetical protein